MTNNVSAYNNIFDCVCDDLMIEMMSYITVNDALNLLNISGRSQSLISIHLRNLSVINRYTIMGTNTRRITTSNMCAILANCRNVKQIDFRNIELLDEESGESSSDDSNDNSIVLSIANGCPNVESIDFDALQVNHNFELLAKNCTKLKNIASKTINDESLKHLLYKDFKLHSLETLDLSQNPNITGHEFKILGPKMKEINLNNSLIDLIPAFQRLSLGYGKQIEKLTVYVNNSLVMRVISGEFIRITHLSLHIACRDIDLSVYLTIRNFPRLSSLSIGVDHLKELFTSCERPFLPRIEELEVTACLTDDRIENRLSGAHFYIIRRIFPHITKLVLREFDTIGERVILTITRLFPHLQHLDLMGCENITDSIAQSLMDRTRFNLRHLNLHNCPRVGLRTLSAFIALPYHFSLDVINTSIRRCDVPNRLPSNLSILVDVSDCVYGCPH